MKRALTWLLVVGMLVGTVLVVWELVAKPGPLRWGWRYLKWKRNPVYEAQVRWPLQRPITEDELKAENQLLDSLDLLMPIVRELELAKRWKVADDTAAMVRLAECSNLRCGVGELELQLYVHGGDRELIGKIINPLAQEYVERKRAQQGLGGGGE